MENLIIWKSGTRKISDLKPAAYNPRKMTKKQEKDLAHSIDKFNLADPIVINADNTIIGGHQRIKILSGRGAEDVDVRIPSRQLNAIEEKELNLRLNKNLGQWDLSGLANFDKVMLVDVGFDADKIFGNTDNKELKTVSFQASQKTKIKLGQHKLIVGKETTPGDVQHIIKCWEEFTGEEASDNRK